MKPTPSRSKDYNLLPTMVVIGAAKCGTTSLHTYLGEHPDIFATRQKELHFFISGENWTTWNRGLAWYKSHFAEGQEYSVRVESSPGYSYDQYSAEVALRLSKTVPNVRLVYMVRDPLERIKSHYIEEVSGGRLPTTVPLERVVRSHGSEGGLVGHFFGRLVRTSMYWTQARRFLKHIPKESLLVVPTDRLERQPREALAEILSFAGAAPSFVPPSLGRKLNPRHTKRLRTRDVLLHLREMSWYRVLRRAVPEGVASWYRKWCSVELDQVRLTELSPEDENYLCELLAPEAVRLQEEFGVDVSTWSVLRR